ncbi:MAG: ATP-binding cassette domain-containing protein [bacterium]|nr:ATP-binding cassette domain-containing protein [bacterium]
MKKICIAAKQITKKYQQNLVLQKIDTEIYQGDFTVIMGNSGSGKSTLLQILSGMDKANSGEISYQNRNIAVATEKELTRIRAKEFGFVFQKNHLVSNLSLYENIVVAGYISGNATEAEVEKRAEHLIQTMNLSEAQKRLPSEVSGGEAQRAAIARAIIGKPQILFADEPTGSLNKANSIEALNLFTKIHKEGQTIVLVTHDKEAALRGNRILYLEDGRITGELEIGEYKDAANESAENTNKRNEMLEKWLKEKGW